MRRKSIIVVLLLALSFGAGTPVYWRAQSSNLSQPHARLAARTAVQAAGRGYPWINLGDGHDLLTSYTGAQAEGLLASQAAQPLALAAGDFDEDGVPDLLSGYDRPGGGLIVLQRGNVDAIYPDTPAAEQRRATGEFTESPFLAPARVFALPAAADFVGAGDFNADGHVDVVAATRGSATLYWLAGDGRGGLGQAQAIELPGNVTALTTGEINRADGLTDVIVGINTAQGAQALVFEGAEGAFSRAAEVIALPAAATALALGQLDEQYEMDFAVAAGQELLIVHGRDRCLSVSQERQTEVQAAAIEDQALPFQIASLTIGDFSGDQRAEIAVLSADGVVQVLGQDARSKQWGKPLGEVATRSQREASTTAVANDQLAPLAAPLLVRARVSVSGYDDLVVVDRNEQQLQILTGGMLRGEEAQAAAEPRAPVALAVAGEPVAVLPMRLNSDAFSDLVTLKSGGDAPIAVALTAAARTFTVNNNGDQGTGFGVDPNKCETAPGNGICTLRAAVETVNKGPGGDMITFSSAYTIKPTVGISITKSVVIDGSGVGRVELDGSNLDGIRSILQPAAKSTVIRGLVINRATSAGIVVTNSDVTIENCYIGTDKTGNTTVDVFGSYGIDVEFGTNVKIGGTASAARNVIGNKSEQIRTLDGAAAIIQGNYLGVGANGSAKLAAVSQSISDRSKLSHTIGGTEPGARNLIASTVRVSDGGTGNIIQGNYFALNSDGAALGNGISAISITNGSDNTIGGTTPAARNVVNGFVSVAGNGIPTDRNKIQGNYVGVDPSGNNALGQGVSGGTGVQISGADNVIGGAVAGAGNVISASAGVGVSVFVATNAKVQGNLIGTNAAGDKPLPNSAHGISVSSSNGVMIGGEGAASNIIAFSNRFGIELSSGTNISISRNSIFGNNERGIASTAKAPVLSQSGSTIQGMLTGAAPNKSFTIEFFSNPDCGAINKEQGKTFIGQITTTTDGSGNSPIFTGPAGQNVTATATAAGGNTSPFSNCAAGGTSCPGFSLQAADPNQSNQDTLTLTKVMPADGEVVSSASLKRGGLKANVTWLLQSSDAGVIDVTLYDQDGNIRYDGGTIPVRKSTCPSAQDIVLDLSRLDLTPKNGIAVTGLKLTAKLMNSLVILKRADVNYPVQPDIIAFEGTPKINGLDAADGSLLPADGKVDFTGMLRYHLTSDLSGTLRLQAFNANTGGAQIASKDLAPKVAANTQPAIFEGLVILSFEVPVNVSAIRLQASLLADNGTVLKTAAPLYYRRALGLAFGSTNWGATIFSFSPFSNLSELVAGEKVTFILGLDGGQTTALKVTADLDLPANTPLNIFLSERLADGAYRRKAQPVPFGRILPFPQPAWAITLPPVVPDDVDLWELELVFFPPGKPPLSLPTVRLPIDRVRIVPGTFTPPPTVELQPGKGATLRCQLEYNANRPGVTQLVALIEFDKVEPTRQLKLLDLKAGDHSPANPPFTEFEVLVPNINLLTFVRVSFYLRNDKYFRSPITQTIEYHNFAKLAQIPSGATTVASTLGLAMNVAQNNAARTGTLARHGTQFKGFLDTSGLSLTAGEAAAGASPFALRYAEAASLLRDFIGVNAYWEFNPPIPADGSFAADLTFSFDAEMLPDDPNFSEAALKVASFDPDNGQLVSYPTTVNLAAKTATTRVNGLARFYTLGVFGPFAQRSLNFPVLQSGDDFATRFNLVNAGTVDAALTLRAYDDAGTNLQAPNLVNPLTATLAAARMLMGSVSELFKSTAPLDGWVQTRSNRNFVAGYELLSSGNRLDGLNAPSGYDSALILPEAFYDATQTTEVHLANATNFAGVVKLELRDATGRLAASEEISLAPKARFAQRLQDIFQNLAQPFTGYLLILSERDLAAAAVQVLEKEISALNAQPLGGGATKLYAPYVPLGGPATARLTLVNPTAQTANLTLRLVNNPGASVTAPVNLTLGAGQQLQRNFSQLFILNQLGFVYSTLVVESNVAGLAGNVTLLNASGAIPFRAALPLESAPANRLVFAHFNTSDGFFTEMGMFNPSAQAARVTLACFKPDGTSLGQTSVTVPAGSVFGDYVDNFVGGSHGQTAGYFTLSSDQPIVAGAAFGTDSGSALAGLPPQTLPSSNTNALATVSAASFTGQTLAANSIVAGFGVNLANSVIVANQVPLPTTLADTIVEVRDSLGVERLAPLFFVSPGQINYLIPPGTANGTATVTATNGAGAVSLGDIMIASVAPGLFAANSNGQGVAAALALRIKANGAQSYDTIARFDTATQVFVSTPIDLGPAGEEVFLILFGTGLRGRSSLTAVTALIGGVSAQVLYAGEQGNFVGLDQVNVAVPRALIGRSEVDVLLMVDGKAANAVRINLK